MNRESERLAENAGDFRPAGIRNIQPGLTERGKIKIGQKGDMRKSRSGTEFQPPQKLDHFTVTTLQRGQDGNFVTDNQIMQMLQKDHNDGQKPTQIPIRLVYDDIDLNFPSRYAAYVGRSLFCTGDGVQARRSNTDDRGQLTQGEFLCSCPCFRQDPEYQGKDKCKITGTLGVIIDGADVVGGVWKFRTTSYNTVVGILSSLSMIKRVSGGRLAGIPLMLTLNPKHVTAPGTNKTQTVYVASVEFRGSMQALRDEGFRALKNERDHGARVEELENEARNLLANSSDPMETEAEDIVDEFYPDAADPDDAVPGSAPPGRDDQGVIEGSAARASSSGNGRSSRRSFANQAKKSSETPPPAAPAPAPDDPAPEVPAEPVPKQPDDPAPNPSGDSAPGDSGSDNDGWGDVF